MNHPSEWTKYYEPRRGKYMYKHKGTGVISSTLLNFGKKIAKPLGKLVFKTASEKVAKNVGEKAAEIVTKKGSAKIQALLNKRKTKPPSGRFAPSSQQNPKKPKVSQKSMRQLNNLLTSRQNPKKPQRQTTMEQLNNLISNL